ncbi:MAG: TlpA family protein disulfide reductase, partial [Marinirhabdus sp.]
EFQALYITPGDSLIMHLDVKAFDESINYSGTGAGKNNLLMHYFLQGEKDAKNMAAYPGVRPLSFLAKLDSLKNDKQKAFARYEQKNEVAPAFGTIIPALIEAERVGLKEMYIAAKYRETNRTAATVGLPPELYVHRENFPYNTPFFAHYFPFVRVADAYFDNLAFENHRTQQAYDRTSFVHNYKKLELLDSLMDNGLLKNKLSRLTARRYLNKASGAENVRQLAALFRNVNTNAGHINEMNKLANTALTLVPGRALPDVSLVNVENELKPLQGLIERPSVLYFWSDKSSRHKKLVHSVAAQLKAAYPEHDFIGLNVDKNFRAWQRALAKANYGKEFQLENSEETIEKLMLTTLNKALMVDENGTILHNNLNIFDPNIEDTLARHTGR